MGGISKLFLKKQGLRMRIGFIWLRTGSCGWLLWTR